MYHRHGKGRLKRQESLTLLQSSPWRLEQAAQGNSQPAGTDQQEAWGGGCGPEEGRGSEPSPKARTGRITDQAEKARQRQARLQAALGHHEMVMALAWLCNHHHPAE